MPEWTYACELVNYAAFVQFNEQFAVCSVPIHYLNQYQLIVNHFPGNIFTELPETDLLIQWFKRQCRGIYDSSYEYDLITISVCQSDHYRCLGTTEKLYCRRCNVTHQVYHTDVPPILYDWMVISIVQLDCYICHSDSWAPSHQQLTGWPEFEYSHGWYDMHCDTNRKILPQNLKSHRSKGDHWL